MLSFLCVSYSYDGRRSGCGHVSKRENETGRESVGCAKHLKKVYF